jgi:hypothetical protein
MPAGGVPCAAGWPLLFGGLTTMNRRRTTSIPRIAAWLIRHLRTDGRRYVYVSSLDSVHTQLAELQRLAKCLRACRARGWTAAEHIERRRLAARLNELSIAAEALRNDLGVAATPLATHRDLLLDLYELNSEFDVLHLDRAGGYLAVTTEPITLEDVPLGRFELRLDGRCLTAGHVHGALSVVARDPHPSASNESITHPHVRDACLCLGDATTAFETAASSGRLADALLLARSVLRTYNPNSPYCPLDAWYCPTCHDCGRLAADESAYLCADCENEYCDDCITSCSICGASRCRECILTCTQCADGVCDDCMGSCPDCSRLTCQACREDGLCSDCLKDLEDKDDATDDEYPTIHLEPTTSAIPIAEDVQRSVPATTH